MCSRLWFSWVSPLITRGAQNQLEYQDLPELPRETEPPACVGLLWQNWQQVQRERRPTLLRAIARSFGGPYWGLAVVNLINDALTFSSTILLNLLVAHLESAHTAAPAAASPAALSNATYAAVTTPHNLLHAAIPTTSSSTSNLAVLSQDQAAANPTTWLPLQQQLSSSQGVPQQHLSSTSSSSTLLWGGGIPMDHPLMGLVYAVLLGLTALLKGVLLAHYNYQLSKITCRLRMGLMGCLYLTALKRRHQGGDESDTGDVSTLMAVDTSRAVNLAISLHALLSLPLQIGVAMYLLYTQVRYAFVAGVILTLALIPVNRLLAVKIQSASTRMMAAKDSRVRIMAQALRSIRVLKMICWEPACVLAVAKARHRELSALAVRKYLDALCVYFWAATQLLFSVLTFGLMVLLGQPLRPSVVFTALALFNVLIAPLNAFPWVINGVVEALVSIQRLQRFMQGGQGPPADTDRPGGATKQQQQQQAAAGGAGASTAQHGPPPATSAVAPTANGVHHPGAAAAAAAGGAGGAPAQGLPKGAQAAASAVGSPAAGGDPLRVPLLAAAANGAAAGAGGGARGAPGHHQLLPGVAVQLRRATYRWHKSSRPCLQEISLSIPLGGFTVITGEVGAGKSSLLAAILGELLPEEGSCSLAPGLRGPGRVAYVGQHPWIMNGAVRDNVLLGQAYEADVVQLVLHAVALDTDVASWPCGDLTPAGDRGSLLSGGQRIRLALARALYQPAAELYLLDDVLSAVDNHTAQWLITHALFGGFLSGRTVVMVTKSAAVVRSASLVVALEHGRVGYVGSPQGYADWKVAEGALGPLLAGSSLPRGQSEDVSPQEVTQALGHGYWHLPASQPPQLEVIEEVSESAQSGGSSMHRISSSRSFSGTRQSSSSNPGAAAAAGPAGEAEKEAAPTAAGTAAGEAAAPPPPASATAGGLPGPTGSSKAAGATSEAGVGNPFAAAVSEARLAAGSLPESGPEQSSRATSNPAGSAAAVGSAGATGSTAARAAAAGSSPTTQARATAAASVDTAATTLFPSAAAAGGGLAAPPPASPGDPGDDNDAAPLQPVAEEESRAQGHVHWGVYAFYFSAVGWPMLLVVISSLLLMQATRNGTDLWVAFSIVHPEGNSNFELGKAAMSSGNGGNWGAGSISAGNSSGRPGGGGLWWSGAGTSWILLPQQQQRQQYSSTVLQQQQQYKWRSRRLLLWDSVAQTPTTASSSSTGVTTVYTAATTTGAAVPRLATTATAVAAPRTAAQAVAHTTAAAPPLATAARATAAAPPQPAAAAGAVPVPPQPAPAPAKRSIQLSWPPHLPDLDPAMSTFLKGLLAIAAANTLATLLRAFSFAAAGMAAARRLHQQLLGAVLAAPMAWFEQHPPGRVLNRFSSDTSTVDDSLPFIFNILLANAVMLLGLLVVLGYSQPLLLLLLAPLGVLYRCLQLFYRGTARQLRRLEAVSLSPLYASFGEVVEGAPAIRAAAAQGYFFRAFTKLLHDNQLTALAGAATSNWLTARLQLLAAVLVSGVAGLAAASSYNMRTAAAAPPAAAGAAGAFSSYTMRTAAAAAGAAGGTLGGLSGAQAWPELAPSSYLGGGGQGYHHQQQDGGGGWNDDFRIHLIGLCLAYALPVVQLLNGLLTSSAETEQEMVAVERVREYIEGASSEEPAVRHQLRRQLSRPVVQQQREDAWSQSIQRQQSTWWAEPTGGNTTTTSRHPAVNQAPARAAARQGGGGPASAMRGVGVAARRAAVRAAKRLVHSTTQRSAPLLISNAAAAQQQSPPRHHNMRVGSPVGRVQSAPVVVLHHHDRQRVGQQLGRSPERNRQQQPQLNGQQPGQQQGGGENSPERNRQQQPQQQQLNGQQPGQQQPQQGAPPTLPEAAPVSAGGDGSTAAAAAASPGRGGGAAAAGAPCAAAAPGAGPGAAPGAGGPGASPGRSGGNAAARGAAGAAPSGAAATGAPGATIAGGSRTTSGDSISKWLMDDTDDSDDDGVTLMVSPGDASSVQLHPAAAAAAAASSSTPPDSRRLRRPVRPGASSSMGYAQPAVQFEQVDMAYSPGAQLALKGVSFSVRLGQTLGVCGRTGAGKSSLLAALLRLNPIATGHIYVHGEDVQQLSLATLRGKFGVMPQAPLLFEGSVRDNLDPFGAHKDEDLTAALQAVRLWEVLCRLALEAGLLMKGSYLAARRGRSVTGAGWGRGGGGGGQEQGGGGKSIRAQAWEHLSSLGGEEQLVSALSSLPLVAQLEHSEEQQQEQRGGSMWRGPVVAVLGMKVAGPGGLQLSSGQKQLLCLARMLLKRASLVLLDECTASVDIPTAQLMREVLTQQVEGEHTAVIQIAHDLNAIREYDAVLVMARGQVVEQGDPKLLAQTRESQFAQLLARAHY